MKVKDVVFSKGIAAFFFDDQRAIKKGAIQDGFIYLGKPVTPKFTSIRQAGQSISVMIILEDDQIAIGDCAAVQYSGAGGRDPLFLADEYIPFLEKHIKPLLLEIDFSKHRFVDLSEKFSNLEIEGKPIHTALKYGITQALLDAKAKASKLLPCEVICQEFNLPIILERIPIFGQTGDSRYENVDKMIIKEVEVLPHGLLNNIDTKIGRNGEKLRDYIRWLAERIKKLRTRSDYKPTLHLDVYGNLGILFDYNFDKIVDYIASLEKDADEFPLYIEGPVDMEEKYLQMEKLQYITHKLKRIGSKVKIVADEWCNTYEDVVDFCKVKAADMIQIKTPDLGGIHNIVKSVIHCNQAEVEAYQGGTCNETEISAKICVHLAIAARPMRMLAKPGMGFDEGFTVVNNELERTLALLRAKYKKN